jgi:fibronectin-binding autotransporter adhesin
LNLNGAISGAGGIAVKENSIVVLTNNNTFTGGIWVEKGTVRLNTHTNAMGAGAISVGTNATLDLQYGGVSLRPVAINLYGTGTNANWGAIRKTTAGASSLRGNITLGADSKVAAPGGPLTTRSNLVLKGFTLYVTNAYTFSMAAGEMSGSKTTGDGALRKSGGGAFVLRPGTNLTGNIFVDQGEIRQCTGTMTGSGTLTMAGGTKYSSDGGTTRTMTKALVINGNVGLAVYNTGGLVITNTVSLGSGTRIVTNNNQVTISGVISSGGLTKAGGGKMILSGANTYALGTLVSAGTLEGTTTSLQGNITNNSAVVFNQSGNGTYAGVLSGTGTLTKQGTGTVTLSGTSTQSGGTTVSAGTLLVSGSLASSAVTVASGATLAGAGTVGALTMQSGSTVSPGNANGTAGTLNVNGAASLIGTYTCDIKSTTSTACDRIAATGSMSASGALTINLPTSAPSGFSACDSYSWTIMSGSSVNAANMSIGTKWASGGTFGVSASGNTIVVTHTPGAPGKPVVTASDGTATAHVALSWGDVSCETGYVIGRNTVDTYATATALYTNAAGVTTYNDATAVPGQLYFYWVTATNAGGSTTSDSNSGYRRLSPPGSVSATDGSSTAAITVTWGAVTGATGYHVFRDTDAAPAGATGLGAQSSPYADTSATPGQLYYYWVVASNSTSSSTSDWSTANSGYRKLATVTGVAATENLSDKIRVTWTDIAGETGYSIWRNTEDAPGSAAIVGTAAANATSYDDTSADADRAYYYWVRGTNSTSASLSDFSASDYGYRILGEPTTPASAILFGDLDTGSYTVSWTRGDGSYVLVVARQGARAGRSG